MLFLSELVLDFQCLYFEICETVPIRQYSSCKHVRVMYTPLHPTFIMPLPFVECGRALSVAHVRPSVRASVRPSVRSSIILVGTL